MPKRSLLILGLLGGVASCVTPPGLHPGGGPKISTIQVACQVNVQLDENDDITVDYEPVRTKRCPSASNKKKVTWKLTSANGYKFDGRNGITFPTGKNPSHPGLPTGCDVTNPGATEFTCDFPADPTRYKWAYVITLVKASSLPKVLDPTIVND